MKVDVNGFLLQLLLLIMWALSASPAHQHSAEQRSAARFTCTHLASVPNFSPFMARRACVMLGCDSHIRLRGGSLEVVDDEDSGSSEGPQHERNSREDDEDEDDADDLLDLSAGQDEATDIEALSKTLRHPQQRTSRSGVGDKGIGDGAHDDDDEGGLEEMLQKFMDGADHASDSDESSNEWVRDLSESAKDDPEFMADLAELEQTLLANQRLPPLSFEERVRSKFVKAARQGKVEVMKTLLLTYEPRVEGLINARCERTNITALMHAAANGHFSAVASLLKRGADVRARGLQQETGMHLAASEGFSEVCVMLYEHDPELLHFRDAWNCTPIMRSIDQGWAHTSKTLYNLGSRLESFGLECSERRMCQGMRWPITRLSLANDTSVVCPLCMYGYILPDSPEGDGHVTEYAALLPPEFYPNPCLSEPKDGSGPTRGGPCWQPFVNGSSVERVPYTGSGQAQQWPDFGPNPAPFQVDEVREARRRVNFRGRD